MSGEAAARDGHSRGDGDQPPTRAVPLGAISLAALFVTALVTAQLTAAKVLAFDVPVSIPLAGSTLILPGASLAIAVMFFASDCYAEVYGLRQAQILVNVAFAMNAVVLALVWSTILAPAAASSIPPEQFRTVLGASTNIVAASLVAYLLSQNWDVYVFHRIRVATGGAHLWLRNVASTASSQAIDTVVFVGLAFFLIPRTLGLGPVLVTDVVVGLIVGQYLLKLLVAIADTPFVYIVTGAIRSYEDRHGSERSMPTDDQITERQGGLGGHSSE